MNLTPNDPTIEQIKQQAADWVMRTERGLTAAEQDALLSWLTIDRRHGEAIAGHKRLWARLDQLGQWRPEHGPRPNRDLLAPSPVSLLQRMQKRRTWLFPLSLAATFAVGAYLAWPEPKNPGALPAQDTPIATITQRTLEDGSVVELNRGAEIDVRYTAQERRVVLKQGEAHFSVAKDKLRPFVVSASLVSVRAVGTAFNVRLAEGSVDVLVTEGKVQVNSSAETVASPAAQPLTILEVGQRTTVALVPAAPPPKVDSVSPDEVAHLLAWQPRVLDFTSTPITQIVAEFNRHNAPVHLVVADSAVAETELSATLRSDNVEGFIRLIEAGFGVRAERSGSTIVLRKTK